jgi:misacylated tRNA(Ala) deacylase
MKKELAPWMHSPEHVLNQTMVRIYGCDHWVPTSKRKTCDYVSDRPFTEEEINQIENRLNDTIQADMVVSEGYGAGAKSQKHYKLLIHCF